MENNDIAQNYAAITQNESNKTFINAV